LGVYQLPETVFPVTVALAPDATLGDNVEAEGVLPLAEEAGLMRPLTTFVLQEALAQSADWRSQGHKEMSRVVES
jgi:EAL domain-containing protein (putative c-di-GMP-specific phosphodiesterase class I)